MTTPADELRTAAQTLRGISRLTFVGPPFPGLAEPLADLLDDQADGDDEGVINPWALAVARAILGRQP
jgi:hypothetical protein